MRPLIAFEPPAQGRSGLSQKSGGPWVLAVVVMVVVVVMVAPGGRGRAEARSGASLDSGETSHRIDLARHRFVVSRWTLADGLPQSSPNALAVADDGYVWVGTEQGLARFDGVDFDVWDTRHGLPGERVTHLAAVRDGLWVGTFPGGLSRFDGTRFAPILPEVVVHALVADRRGGAWVGTNTGLRHISPQGEPDLDFPSKMRVRALLVEGDDGLLVGHEAGLDRRGPSGTVAQVPLGEVDPPVSGLARAGDELWVGASNGFWRRAEGRWQPVLSTRVSHPQVTVDRGGDVWLWSGDRGVRRFHDGRLERVPELAETEQLVFAVVPDGERTVWLGIGGEGLLRLRRPSIGKLTREDGLPASAVHGVLEAKDGSLWVGTLGSGLIRIVGDTVEVVDEEQGLPSPTVTWLGEARDGRIVVGTDRGTVIGDAGGFSVVPELAALEARASRISLATAEPDGSLLLVAGGSIYRWEPGRVEPMVEQVLGGGTVEAVMRDRQGDLWVTGLGVCRLGGEGLDCFSEADGLPPHFVRTLFETPSGDLWFGTYGGGLCRFEAGSFACISEDRGLPHRTVHNILLDDLGWVWLPSNRGLGRARLEDLQRAFVDPSHVVAADVFGLEDGLPDLELNGGVTPPGVQLRDGRLALPTMGGLALVDPTQAAALSAEPPVVHLESVVVDGRELAAASVERLPSPSHRITFHYTAIHTRAGNVRFRYRLEGHDGAWQPPVSARSVSYTGLGPGRYGFRLQARSGASPWSDESAVAFEIPPHFWQTPWFVGLVVVSILTILFVLDRLRSVRRQELERIRLGIASDLHDELSGELSAIALSSAIAQRRPYLEEPERNRLSEIESTAREVITGLRDLVWAINPEHDTLEAMVGRMRATTAQLLEGLQWSFQEDWTRVDDPLSMAVRRDLFLVFKEALTNSVRHAAAGRVAVRLDRGAQGLSLEVEDDGRGFDPASVESGSGLASMRRRAERIGGSLSLESSLGQGTSLRLEVPFSRLRGGRVNSGWSVRTPRG